MVAYAEVFAFTDRAGWGNRAGVVLDGSLSAAQMQCLAAFIGAPETVFVVGRVPGGAQVRYFTPTQEIDFCGHATVALGWQLVWAERLRPGTPFLLETRAGSVSLRADGDRVWYFSPPLDIRPVLPLLAPELTGALGLPLQALHTELPLVCACAGGWSVFLPLARPSMLAEVELDLSRVAAVCEALGVISLYVYAPLGGGRFAARDFAPLVGIPEDPVTGSGGGALIGVLAARGHLMPQGEVVTGVIEQGRELGTPGEVAVRVRLGAGQEVQHIEVGGQAVCGDTGEWHAEP